MRYGQNRHRRPGSEAEGGRPKSRPKSHPKSRSDDQRIGVRIGLGSSDPGTGRRALLPSGGWSPKAGLTAALLLGGLAFMLFGSEPVLPGRQAPGPAASVGTAAEDGWWLMAEDEGAARPGFPQPMVRFAEDLCVGFGRTDFPAERRRPSLARCVAMDEVGNGQDTLTPLDSIPSGRDTWHFVVMGAPVDQTRAVLADGSDVPMDRVHVRGAVVALRLRTDAILGSVEWSTEHGTFRCAPSRDEWLSGRFCALGP